MACAVTAAGLPKAAHTERSDSVALALDVCPEAGLDSPESVKRLVQWGPNTLPVTPPRPPWRVLLAQFKGVMIVILLGAALLATFHWVVYVFGVFLVITAARLLFGKDEEVHPECNPVLRIFRRLIPVTAEYEGAHFIIKRGGRWLATPLLMVLVVIEATDVVFAVDSIPAVFGVTRDVFIVYTSNIFAILGLRALCFLVASLVRKLRFLKVGLALVLGFVGIKMLLADRFPIPDYISLLVVAGLILGAGLASLVFPPPDDDAQR